MAGRGGEQTVGGGGGRERWTGPVTFSFSFLERNCKFILNVLLLQNIESATGFLPQTLDL